MTTTVSQLPTSGPARWWKSARALAIARLLVFVGVLTAFKVGCAAAATQLLHTTIRGLFSKPFLVLFPVLVPIIVGAFALYWLGARILEKRTPRELSPRDAVTYLPLGLVCGFLAFCVVLGAIGLHGDASFGGYSGFSGVPAAILVLSAGVVFEELVYRGGIFRIVEEEFGTTVALFISAALFGGSHIGNNGASFISVAAIALTGGMAWGLTYTLSKSLWIPIGMHLGWNVTQGALFGSAISGLQIPSAFKIDISGPAWVTGGAFGPEASIYSTVLGVILVAILGIRAHRGHHWVRGPRGPSATLCNRVIQIAHSDRSEAN